jgi:hypothetical protein
MSIIRIIISICREKLISGAGTVYHSGVHPLFLVGFVLLDLKFYVYFL